jgi:hypothetical protein
VPIRIIAKRCSGFLASWLLGIASDAEALEKCALVCSNQHCRREAASKKIYKNINRKTIALLIALFMLNGCYTGNNLVTINGEPGAEHMLRTQTISTRIPKDANLMTKQAERTLKAALVHEKFHYVPTGGMITMEVSMRHAGREFQEWADDDKIGIAELDLKASNHTGVFWEAQISGDSEDLNGSHQEGCIRAMLRNSLADKSTEERKCYRSFY